MIKILYLGSTGEYSNYNAWFTFNFMEVVNTLPGVEVKFYGPRMAIYYPKISIIEYNEKNTLKSLSKLYNFNVVIASNLNRMYFRHKLTTPSDFKDYPCLKLAIEGDFHFHKLKKPSHIIGISLMLHRHLNTYRLGHNFLPNLKHFWFPCSVNTNIFYPHNQKRHKKVCFIGSYKRDQSGMSMLSNRGLLIKKGKVFYEEYLQELQKHVIYFNNSGFAKIDNAKSFEILASGGIMLTNQCNNGFKRLFGENTYISYTHSNIIQKTTEMLNNKQLQEEYIFNALKIINEKHTHEVRAKQLIEIIEREL
jgi:hypothetical protein